MKISPGDSVLTKYGVGVVVRCFNDDRQPNDADAKENNDPTWAVVRLWRLPGKSIASASIATMRVDCIMNKIVSAPGMIVHADDTAETINDQSDNIAENGNAPHDGNAESKAKEKKQKLYLIERYLPEKNVYLATPMSSKGNHHSLARSLAIMSSPTTKNSETNDNPDLDLSSSPSSDSEGDYETSIAQEEEINLSAELRKNFNVLQPHQINASSTSAKFYPVLEDLIKRGEDAWSLAMEKSSTSREPLTSAVTNALSSTITVTSSNDVSGINSADASETVAKFISDTSKTSIQSLNEQLASTKIDENGEINPTTLSARQVLTSTSAKAKSATNAALEGVSLPEAQEIKQIYQMLKDEDLTTLLQKGRERLKELVEKEIPVRTKNALAAVGIEVEEDNYLGSGSDATASVRGSVDKLRKEALASLEQILKISRDSENNILIQTSIGGDSLDSTAIKIDTNNILAASSSSHMQAQQQFAKMFDHLSTVSGSDSQLLQIFSSISEKTKLWQEMTGRLLQTKTASLFMEGSQRLRSRAAHLLKITPGQIRGAVGGIGGGVGSVSGDNDFTRAFTEGDVAMAKLKSMEMGDAVRQRLFAAIEMRSESSGGLDAIIAGSLTALTRAGDTCKSKAASLLENKGLEDLTLSSTTDAASAAISEDGVQSVISSLQQSATSAMKGTKETLIALLSQKSGYRDAVLLRLEHVFLDLESELGRDMTAEEIASLARGDGGSMALFQPVAMKAAKEIETQLDAAEKSLKGSKNWNPKMIDAMGKVRQITKGELSMSDILDMAAGFLDDEEVVAKGEGLMVKAEEFLDEFEAASARLVEGGASKVGDAKSTTAAGIMDAVQKAGITKDEVMKHVESFDVNKLLDSTGNVMTDEAARRELISSAADTALDFLLRILPSMPVPPFDGVRDGLVYHLSNLSMAGFKVKKEDIHIEVAGIKAVGQNAGSHPQSRKVKQSELLIIDIKNISATLDDAMWSFEQTYMPYLKGSGKANTKLWDGSIRLKFELRRRMVKLEEDSNAGEQKWEPVLCLNDRYVILY